MNFYKVKVDKFLGTSFKEINKKAQLEYNKIKTKTKRRPYTRSTYFNKSKIFLGLFWSHLYEKKTWGDRERRLSFFPCAIELIKNSKIDPESREDSNKKSDILHRFYGITGKNEKFCVQIKENKKTNEKY
uniref:Uncharacterized protein n=1 Tax=candidate division CPR3 bacterium TaxID=2268181 RepID=A0A7C4R5G3_UNCC3